MLNSEITSGILHFGKSKVHCLKMGHGKKLIIAFHGFGNTAGIFKPFLPYLKEDYTLVSIDLPGHGSTKWEEKYMLPKDLMALVQGIKNDFQVEKFSLMGYSLGGRLALTIVDLQASWVDRLVLLAADGMEKNFWYSFATKNPVGKHLFQHVLNHPQAWLKRMALLKKFNLIDDSRYKFTSSRLLNKAVNAQVALVWPMMSKLIPSLPVVKYNLKKQAIPVDVFMGRYDRIFKFKIGERFLRGLKTGRLHVLETGHGLLNVDSIAKIAQVFLK